MDTRFTAIADRKERAPSAAPNDSRSLNPITIWSLALACASIFCGLLALAFVAFVVIGILLAWISLIVGCRAIYEYRTDNRFSGQRIAVVGVIVGYATFVMWWVGVAAALFDPGTALVVLGVGLIVGSSSVKALVPPEVARQWISFIVVFVVTLLAVTLFVYAVESGKTVHTKPGWDGIWERIRGFHQRSPGC